MQREIWLSLFVIFSTVLHASCITNVDYHFMSADLDFKDANL